MIAVRPSSIQHFLKCVCVFCMIKLVQYVCGLQRENLLHLFACISNDTNGSTEIIRYTVYLESLNGVWAGLGVLAT